MRQHFGRWGVFIRSSKRKRSFHHMSKKPHVKHNDLQMPVTFKPSEVPHQSLNMFTTYRRSRVSMIYVFILEDVMPVSQENNHSCASVPWGLSRCFFLHLKVTWLFFLTIQKQCSLLRLIHNITFAGQTAAYWLLFVMFIPGTSGLSSCYNLQFQACQL